MKLPIEVSVMMWTIFPSLNRGYAKQVDYEDQLLQTTPKDFKECAALAKEAVELSRFKDARSKQLWLHVLKIARGLKLDLKELFEVRISDGRTILQACIDAQDWDSCLEFVFALPQGRYCDGRILRKGRALILDEDGPEKQKGVLATPTREYCAGDLKSGQMHGKIVVKSLSGNIFEGEFKNGQKHGWGIYRDGASNRVSHEGIFIEGRWIGNPHEIGASRSHGIRGYFFK